jgi:hypothetical protein
VRIFEEMKHTMKAFDDISYNLWLYLINEWLKSNDHAPLEVMEIEKIKSYYPEKGCVFVSNIIYNLRGGSNVSNDE